MDQLSDALAASLELVADRCGDPAPLVYDRLFAQQPDMRDLFVGDHAGVDMEEIQWAESLVSNGLTALPERSVDVRISTVREGATFSIRLPLAS